MPDGILIIDKPEGWTSFDVVAKLRRVFNTKKIGHTGTLDPMATGVLCVFLGGATKFIGLLPCKDKRYTAEVTFGLSTDTGDITGEIINRCENIPSDEQLSEAVGCFVGEISQIPPAYSAVKVNGRPLYKAARRGEKVSAPPRRVTVHSLEMLEHSREKAILDVKCSEGTYIRTLAEDIALKCGSLATLSSLRRTKSGKFDLAEAIELEQVVNSVEPERYLLPIGRAFSDLSMVEVDELRMTRLKNGLSQRVEGVEGLTRLFYGGEFVGLVTGDGDTIKAVRMCQY